MTRRMILEHPDPRLRQKTEDVTEFDADLAHLIDDLIDTLHATTALALSAPQIGDLRSVLVMDLSEDRSAPQVYVNPHIDSKTAWGLVEESCLSVPGIVGNVVRATELRVRSRDRDGALFQRELSGMEAVCLQHEMDHLRGVLFIDRLSILRKLSIGAKAWLRSRRRTEAA